MAETDIPPPVNPLTRMLNLQVLRFAAGQFMSRYLPEYAQAVTSDLRTTEHNEAVGGAPNSAHLHGLAEDFQLRYKAGPSVLTEAQARKIYDTVIAPNWPGFSEFEKSSTGEGYHIHWNLSREISTYAGLVAVAGLGVVGLAWLNRNH